MSITTSLYGGTPSLVGQTRALAYISQECRIFRFEEHLLHSLRTTRIIEISLIQNGTMNQYTMIGRYLIGSIMQSGTVVSVSARSI